MLFNQQEVFFQMVMLFGLINYCQLVKMSALVWLTDVHFTDRSTAQLQVLLLEVI